MSMSMSMTWQILQRHKNQNFSRMKHFPFKLKNSLVTHQGLLDGKKYFCIRGNIQWIIAILSKACKTDNFELLNFLNLTFADIRDLCSNFVNCEFFLETFVHILLIVNFSLNQTTLTFLLCVRLTWMTPLTLAISLWEVIFL